MNVILLEQLHEDTEIKNRHWLWIGPKVPGGYGQTRYNGDTFIVSRLSLCIFFPKLSYKDKSWQACHIDSICGYKNCWSPLHLYIGNPQSNMDDLVRSPNFYYKVRPTHCPHGHEYTPENTYIRPDGGYYCKVCRYESVKKSYSKYKDYYYSQRRRGK